MRRLKNIIGQAKPIIVTETGWELLVFGWCESCEDCSQNLGLVLLSQYVSELLSEKDAGFEVGGKIVAPRPHGRNRRRDPATH